MQSFFLPPVEGAGGCGNEGGAVVVAVVVLVVVMAVEASVGNAAGTAGTAGGAGDGASAGGAGDDDEDDACGSAGVPITASSSGVASGLTLALVGNSCSDRNLISVPLMIKQSFLRSMHAWCRFSMSSPKSKSTPLPSMMVNEQAR